MDSLGSSDLQFWQLIYMYRWAQKNEVLKLAFKGSAYRIPHLQWAVSTSRVCSEVLLPWWILSGPHTGNQDEACNTQQPHIPWGFYGDQAFFFVWKAIQIGEFSTQQPHAKMPGREIATSTTGIHADLGWGLGKDGYKVWSKKRLPVEGCF